MGGDRIRTGGDRIRIGGDLIRTGGDLIRTGGDRMLTESLISDGRFGERRSGECERRRWLGGGPLNGLLAITLKQKSIINLNMYIFNSISCL